MNVRPATIAALLVLATFAAARPAESARQGQPAPVRPARQAVEAPQAAAVQRVPVSAVPPEGAEQTRKALRKVLSYYSPNLGRVLALDPLLMQNAAYLEPYPELVVFLGQHPEVTRNPSYYLADLRPDYYTPPDRDARVLDMWGDFFAAFAVFGGFIVFVAAVAFVIRTLVDYRRWSRLSKVQTEAHNKLLDRFTASEELIAYINTPSGKRFLESAPIMLDTTTSVASPLKRILWAVEIGVVLACAAAGILVARVYVPAELMQPFSVAGIFIISIGVGFVLAAVASFLISKRLGVLSPLASGTGRADVPPAA